MFLPRFVIGCSKRWCDWSIYKSTLGCLGVPLLWDGFFFRFCTISVWMYHETSARCRASRSVKQFNLPLASSLSQSLYSSPRPYPPPPPFGSNPSSLTPTTLCPLLPPSPFIPARAFCTLPVTLPVNHTSISVPRPPPTVVPSFTSPPCPFRQSSILQTSVSPGLLIPCAFYTPPALT